MDDKMSGYGLIIFLILLFFIFNRGFGFGGGCGGYGLEPWGCNKVTNCEVEKQGLINTAQTQFKVVDSARATQDTVIATTNALGNKIDFYEYQNLRDQLAQERNKNMVLENRVYSDAKFNALEAQLAELSCNVAKRPPFYAAGGNPCATIYPTGCGTAAPALV